MERVKALEGAATVHEAELVRINGEAAGLVAALRTEFEALRTSAEDTRRLAELATAAAKIEGRAPVKEALLDPKMMDKPRHWDGTQAAWRDW